MLRSMYAAVSGVKAHQVYLDNTGNNIANVNTVGFKRDVIHFRDMIYQTIKNPSQPNPSTPIGGVNPAQVGLGVAVGSIETVHTQGSMQNTGIPTDMAIQGEGFFVVRNGGQQLYTRAGNFALDKNGNLVMQGNGYLVQGYKYNDVIDPATGSLVRERDPSLTGINIPIGAKIPAKATTLAAFRCNLCNTATPEIIDLTSIPGGSAKIERPHDYVSFGGVDVTYVGDSNSRAATDGVTGDTFFDIDDNMIYTWGPTGEFGWESMKYTINRVGNGPPPAPETLPIEERDGYMYFDRDDGKLYTFSEVRWGSQVTNIAETSIGNGTPTPFPAGLPNGSNYFRTDLGGGNGQIHTYTVANGWGTAGATITANLVNFDVQSAPDNSFYIYNPGTNQSEWRAWELTTPGSSSAAPNWTDQSTIATNPINVRTTLPDPADFTVGNRVLVVNLTTGTGVLHTHGGASGWSDPGTAVTVAGINSNIANPNTFYTTNNTYLYTDPTTGVQTISTYNSFAWTNTVVAGRGNNSTYTPTAANGQNFNYFGVTATGIGTVTGNIIPWSATNAWAPTPTSTLPALTLPFVNTRGDLTERSGEIGDTVFCLEDRRIYMITATGWAVTLTVLGETTPPYPGEEGNPIVPSNGDTYFDPTGDGTIIRYGPLQSWTNEKLKAYETYYIGQNTLAYIDGARIYSDGLITPGVVVSGRVILDDAKRLEAGAVQPDRSPVKAGETFLDTRTGIIYTADSLGNEWIRKNPPDEMKADTAYAIRNFEPNSANIFVLDAYDPPAPMALREVLDSSTGNRNVFTYDADLVRWKSANDTQNSPTALSPSASSVTTQERITEFGQSMILSRDYEDKFTVYDSLGNPHTMIVAFRKVFDRPADPNATPPTGAESEWDWYAYYAGSDGKVQPQYGQGAGTMVFGDDGLLKRTYTYEPVPPTPNPNATNEPTPPQYLEWRVIEKIIDPSNPSSQQDASKPTGLVVADFNVAGAQGTADGATYGSNMIRLDFLGDEYAATLGLSSTRIDGVTSFGSQSTTKMSAQDGYAMGVLQNWSVGGDGTIVGSYDNGQILPIAQIALAMFANAQGLSKMGETTFAETINSGIAQIGEPMSGGAGSVVGNTIEMSNVDLSEEFVNLIRAQRGFQANTRVVSTSDEVLQELINMKR